MNLTVPMKSGELAKLVGWNPKRMRRLIDRLAEQDPKILIRVNGARMVTLASLRKYWPDFAKHLASADDVNFIAREHEEQSTLLETIARRVGELRNAVTTLTERLRHVETRGERQQSRLDKLALVLITRKKPELAGQMELFQ